MKWFHTFQTHLVFHIFHKCNEFVLHNFFRGILENFSVPFFFRIMIYTIQSNFKINFSSAFEFFRWLFTYRTWNRFLARFLACSPIFIIVIAIDAFNFGRVLFVFMFWLKRIHELSMDTLVKSEKHFLLFCGKIFYFL